MLFASDARAVAAASPALDEYRRLIVAGDGTGALAALAGVPAAGRTERESTQYACLSRRLAGAEKADVTAGLTDKPGAMRILNAYRAYWRAALAGENGQAALLGQLNAVLPDGAWDRASIDDASSEAKRYLEGQGLHAITGVTRPYYELMLWTSETRQEYRVDLKDQQVTVPVVFMDGFASRGWLNFATCEWFGAGGWTAGVTLYALRSSYDLDSETFRISYLGHEGRHFADNRQYPKLDQAELEYRAKLTELALSRESTRVLLDRFVRGGRQGREAPHPHAEYWLAKYLQQRLFAGSTLAPRDEDWSRASDEAVRKAAWALLEESSSAAKRGAPTFLPD